MAGEETIAMRLATMILLMTASAFGQGAEMLQQRGKIRIRIDGNIAHNKLKTDLAGVQSALEWEILRQLRDVQIVDHDEDCVIGLRTLETARIVAINWEILCDGNNSGSLVMGSRFFLDEMLQGIVLDINNWVLESVRQRRPPTPDNARRRFY